jgi:hypothetical protein
MSPARRRSFGKRRACVSGTVDCQRHGRSGWVAYKAKHPERAAFYASSTWRFMRDRQLKDYPDFVVCGQKASHADHVVAIANGGTTDGQLQSMCAEHHHEKTVRDSHQAAKRTAAARRRERRPR